VEGGEGGKGGMKAKEREERWKVGKVSALPPHDLFSPRPFQYIVSIAAAEKRPLRYKTPQSVHMV